MTNELATIPQEPSVAIMLQGMLSGIQSSQITPQSVDVLKGMMDLYERNEKRQAEKDFAAALCAMQEETGAIKAMSTVCKKDGTEMYKFAKFEHIMEKAKPLMSKHGFSHSFDTVSGDGTLTAIFKLTHRSGHSQTNQFQVRVAKGQNTNDAQDDMGAKSYAKRGAVCDGLGIVISHDTDGDDARGLGAPISGHDAMRLRARAAACGAHEGKLLAFLGVKSFEEISESRMKDADDALAAKEKKNAAANKETGEEKNPDGSFKF